MSAAGSWGMSLGGTSPWISHRSIWWSIFRNCIIVDVYQDRGTVSERRTGVAIGGQAHLFGHQKVSVIRVYRTLPTIVDSVVLVHLTLRVIVLELKHNVCEAVDRVKLLRAVPLNFVNVQVGADSPWGVRSSVGSRYGAGWE